MRTSFRDFVKTGKGKLTVALCALGLSWIFLLWNFSGSFGDLLPGRERIADLEEEITQLKQQNATLVARKKAADDLKAQYVAEGEALLAQVTTSDFEIVNNQVESLRNSLEALKKDEDELLVLSEGTVADSAFDEKLKQERANQDVANAYQEEADKSMADQINNYPVPYCAVY